MNIHTFPQPQKPDMAEKPQVSTASGGISAYELGRLVSSRVIGNAHHKAVLRAMVDLSDRNGTNIFASVASFADLAEISLPSARRAVAALKAAGLIIKTGTRPCVAGFTVIYRINIAAVRALPQVRAPRPPVDHFTPIATAEEAYQADTPHRHSDGPPPSERPTTPVTQTGHHRHCDGQSDPGSDPVVVVQRACAHEETQTPTIPPLNELLDRCIAAAHPHGFVDPVKDRGGLMFQASRIKLWIQQGCSLEEDILPTITALTLKAAAKGERIRSWHYFEDPVVAARDNRLRPLAEPAPRKGRSRAEEEAAIAEQDRQAAIRINERRLEQARLFRDIGQLHTFPDLKAELEEFEAAQAAQEAHA